MENDIANTDAAASGCPVASPSPSTGPKKSSAFLIVFLLLTVVGLVAIDIYQDHVIQRQRYELRWLLTHSVIRPDVPATDIKSQQPAPKAEGTPSSAANVAPAQAPATAPAKPAPQPPAAAKP